MIHLSIHAGVPGWQGESKERAEVVSRAGTVGTKYIPRTWEEVRSL